MVWDLDAVPVGMPAWADAKAYPMWCFVACGDGAAVALRASGGHARLFHSKSSRNVAHASNTFCRVIRQPIPDVSILLGNVAGTPALDNVVWLPRFALHRIRAEVLSSDSNVTRCLIAYGGGEGRLSLRMEILRSRKY